LSFIESNFMGYEFERRSEKSVLNPLTEGTHTIEELKNLPDGFVGIQHGISGLLSIPKHDLKNRKFQFSTQNMEDRRNWLKLDTFISLVAWVLEGTIPDIKWDNRFPFETVEKIAGSFKEKVFIGIRGGEKKLSSMGWDEIIDRSWEIFSEERSKDWIPGDEFLEIISKIKK